MNPAITGAFIVAGASVLGSIGAVLLLAFRVGRLTGQYEARLQFGDADRVNIWKQIGALGSKVDRHIESRHT